MNLKGVSLAHLCINIDLFQCENGIFSSMEINLILSLASVYYTVLFGSLCYQTSASPCHKIYLCIQRSSFFAFFCVYGWVGEIVLFRKNEKEKYFIYAYHIWLDFWLRRIQPE